MINTKFKFLPYLAMVFMMIKLLTVILIYKVITIHGIDISVSALIIPFWFICTDIIAEMYGYKTARNLIFASIVLQIVFGLLLFSQSFIEPAEIVHKNDLYAGLFNNMLRVSLASGVGIMGGEFTTHIFCYGYAIRLLLNYHLVLGLLLPAVLENYCLP